MDVSDVLRDRMQEPGGLQRMVAVSAAAHAALFLALLLAPTGLFDSGRDASRRTVMTISLGGGVGGPESGGATSIGGRPVQVATPADAPKRPEPVRPPAAKAPEMTVPERGARRARQSADVAQAPDDARGRTPTKGAEPAFGSAVAETGVRGQGFGLSTGGQEGSGSYLDVADFCCPDYLLTMVQRIRSNWNQSAGRAGDAMVQFTIDRSGRITNVMLEKQSGNPIADLNAQRAVLQTAQLPALPSAFPNPTLTVHLNFRYTR
jgi:TonB family protein